MHNRVFIFVLLVLFSACSGKENQSALPPTPKQVTAKSITIDNTSFTDIVYNTGINPVLKVHFTQPIKPGSVAAAVSLKAVTGALAPINTSLQNNDSVLLIQPTTPLSHLERYKLEISDALLSATDGKLVPEINEDFVTKIDSSAKFPALTDEALLTLVQQQTFKYFWDYGHPVSGLARERSNATPETVTSGGSGFGIMAILTGAHRNFITRAQALQRTQAIVSFLKNTAQKFHGAFSHWINGTSGAVIPFSAVDNGADLVETSYLVMGLLCARQYFNGVDAGEANLRNDINSIWHGVEWNWFRRNNENVLYWHWSPDRNWDMNMPIRGWNESLITYVLAASSPNYSIPKAVYDNGWAQNGAIRNNNTYYGFQLPLGEPYGGPLFFSHYSFMGINPNGLSDAYANYQTQVTHHSKINYQYCLANPNKYFGYSSSTWGLTASDIPDGYTASSPTNDVGVIAPTAAISSLPYTPAESMQALRFFYYTLGDKLWKQYGFVDACSLKEPWFADSHLAIDQGPIIVMIENYRSGLLWNLFTSCTEVKAGMLALGFSAPYL